MIQSAFIGDEWLADWVCYVRRIELLGKSGKELFKKKKKEKEKRNCFLKKKRKGEKCVLR